MSLSMRAVQNEIIRLKKENDIAILAHSYQSPDILEIADLTGDSYKLSAQAASLTQSTIIMCGVRFMAETVKLLSPQKRVILPIRQATCPMAEQISPMRVVEFKKANPNTAVVAYVNTTAALKAVCDVCVTSSSAVKIVSKLPQRDILFIPDKNLGSYVAAKLSEKNIILWDGYCPVHNAVTAKDCEEAIAANPGKKLLLHPELPSEVLAYGDVIGSTADILSYALSSGEDCIIGTEKSISDYLKLARPERSFPLLSKKLICPDMRITGLQDVYAAVAGKGEEFCEIEIDEAIREAARHSIDEMIRLG